MKLNILKPVMAAIVLILGLTSCSDDNWSLDNKMPKGQGQVSLNDFDINLKDVSQVSPTRAAQDVSSFIVEILRKSDNSVVKSYTYSSVPEIITLDQGEYIAKAYSHNPLPAEWEKPYYEGTKDFKIEAGKITPIGTLTCSFASIKVTIEYSKELLDLMDSDCSIDVDYNNGTTLTFTPQETRAGYFKAVENGTTMVVKLSGTINAHYEEFTLPLGLVSAGQWRLIRLDAKNADTSQSNLTGGAIHQDESTGTSGISLTFTVIDNEINGALNIDEETIEVTRPGQEELPKDPGTDPNPGTDPGVPTNEPIRFTCKFDNTKVTDITKLTGTEEFVVIIDSDNGIANVDVTIDSSALTPDVLQGVGLTSQFDLAYPGELEEGLQGLGFPTGDAVIGEHQITFDITEFVPLLGIYSGTSNFILEVKDSEGESNSITLSFKK